MLYHILFEQLGMSKNEAKIYQTLLEQSESSVSTISKEANIHRRNIYDALHRLIEKGFVFEIVDGKQNTYQAVEPNKLMETLQEKQETLQKIMPDLEDIYHSKPHKNEVYMYRGLEGWKNYMRDILRINKDVYFIGGKGAWLDERLENFFDSFIKQSQKKGITYHHIFDYEVKEKQHDILQYVGSHYRFFPKGYSTDFSVAVFGDYVNIISHIYSGEKESDFSFTILVNKQIAIGFRTWFQCMWDLCSEK